MKNIGEKLLQQELRRRRARYFFEHATEMMRILEAQQVGHFAYAEPFHQESLGLVDDEIMDVADGGAPGGLMDHVAEVTGRIGQLTCAPCNGWESLFMLQAFREIVYQQAVEAFEDVTFATFFLARFKFELVCN